MSEQNKDKLNKLKADLALNHARVEATLTSKKKDIVRAKNRHIEMLTFNLQKTLLIPKIYTDEAYYKRQLSVYIQGMNKFKNDKATMHVWHEGLASHEPNKILSCLLKY